MPDIIRFHVPCKLEYTRMVEEVMLLVSSYVKSGEKDEVAEKLRTVINEVFVNIVEHSRTAGEDEIVRFQFELGIKYFTISIYDNGPGFKAGRHMPPYPAEVVGRVFKLRDVLDGRVNYRVVDPFTVSFLFEKKESRMNDKKELQKFVDDHGLGISIITRVMDSVTYTYIGQGKYDWKLIHKL